MVTTLLDPVELQFDCAKRIGDGKEMNARQDTCLSESL